MIGGEDLGVGGVDTAANAAGGGGGGGGGNTRASIAAKFSGVIVTSNGGATQTYLGDPGSQPLINSDASSTIEYPTAAGLISALAVCAITGNGATPYTVTLYHRPFGGALTATAVAVTVPAGAAIGQVFEDIVHSETFGEKDTFALLVTSAATGEGNKVMTASLLGPLSGGVGFGPRPPNVQSASQPGTTALASRSDHTHGLDLVAYTPSLVALQASGIVQQTFGGGIATPVSTNMPNGVIPFGSGGILAQDGQLNWLSGARSLGIGVALGSIGAPLHVNTQNHSPAALFSNPNNAATGVTLTQWDFAGVTLQRHFVNQAQIGDVIWAGPDVTTGFLGTWTFEKNSGASGAVGALTIGGLGAIVGGNVGNGSSEGTLEIVAENILGTGASDLSGNQQIAIALSGNFAQTIKKTNTKGGPLPGGTTPDLTIVQTVGGASLNISHTAGQGVGNVINVIRNGTTVAQWDRIGTLFLTTLVNTTNDQPSTLVATARAHTGQGPVEIPDFVFDGSATMTFAAAGGLALIRGSLFKPRTYADSVVALTITDAATVGIDGAPAAGTNVVILHPWALHVRTGATKLQDLQHAGTNLGFFATTATTQKTVTGSRGGNAALASLLTQLAAYGLIVDGSSP
jgi:hypothetical protein